MDLRENLKIMISRSLIGKLTGSSNAPDIARANEKANQGGGISIYLILILLIVITCLILKKYYS